MMAQQDLISTKVEMIRNEKETKLQRKNSLDKETKRIATVIEKHNGIKTADSYSESETEVPYSTVLDETTKDTHELSGLINMKISKQRKNKYKDCSWLRDVYKRKKKEAIQKLSSKPQIDLLPPPEKLPRKESEYTDVFQQYIVNGLALKKAIVERLQKVNGVESLGTGFSMKRAGYWPVIRVMADETTCNEIKQQEQRKSDLVHEVTAALHNTLTQLYTASWSPEELENMIEIVINYPLKAFDLCTAGETITTTYDFSNQTATKIGCMAFSVRHCLTVGEIKRVAHYCIGAFHTVIPSRSLDYRTVLDPLPVNEGQQTQQTQLQYIMVHEPVAQITVTRPTPQEDPRLINIALRATMSPERVEAELQSSNSAAYGWTLQPHSSPHITLKFLSGKMGLFKQDSDTHSYAYVLVASNSPGYSQHQCNIDIGILRKATNEQNVCNLERPFINLKAGEGVSLPSKIKWYKPPQEEIAQWTGTVVFINDGTVHKLSDSLAQIHAIEYPCCQWEVDTSTATAGPGDSGAPVFLQRDNEFHLIGILITERSATPVDFALKIMHTRIAILHVQEILHDMITTTYVSDDRLERYEAILELREEDQSLLPNCLELSFSDLQANDEPLIPQEDDEFITSSLDICIPHDPQ